MNTRPIYVNCIFVGGGWGALVFDKHFLSKNVLAKTLSFQKRMVIIFSCYSHDIVTIPEQKPFDHI